jgi:hypothetical protein
MNAPCHNLSYRAIPVFINNPDPTMVCEVLVCGKDGFIGEEHIECWRAYSVVRGHKNLFPQDLSFRLIRELVDGKRPVYRHTYGYFLERDMQGWSVVTNPGAKAQPDFKAAAAGDDGVPF